MSKYCKAITATKTKCSREISLQGGDYCRFHLARMAQNTELDIKKELAKIDAGIANTLILNSNHDINPKVEKLLIVNNHMPEQRTKEWYEYRKEIMTASPAGAYITVSEYEYNLGQQGLLCIDTEGRKIRSNHIGHKRCGCFNTWKGEVQQKCLEDVPWRSNKYMRHGVKYEPVICNIYEEQANTKVLEFGIMPHPTIDWIGASPDGITIDGKMVEIKAPSRDKLTKEVILQYWVQMQLQMEVCDLDECDFVEARIVEYRTKEDYINDKYYDEEGNLEYYLTEEGFPKGVVINIEKNFQYGPNQTIYEHIYPPALTFKNETEEQEWITQWFIGKANEGTDIFFDEKKRFTISYYKVIEWEVQTIKRDRIWFELRKPDFEKSWNQILQYRKEGVPKEFQRPDEHAYTSADCLILDTDDENETDKTPKNTIPKLDLSQPNRKAKNDTEYEVDVF